MVQLGVAFIGALGTVVSAYLVLKVRAVQREVNGHTAKLERKIAELRRALDRETSG